jgi:uncharacterized membrane protein
MGFFGYASALWIGDFLMTLIIRRNTEPEKWWSTIRLRLLIGALIFGAWATAVMGFFGYASALWIGDFLMTLIIRRNTEPEKWWSTIRLRLLIGALIFGAWATTAAISWTVDAVRA